MTTIDRLTREQLAEAERHLVLDQDDDADKLARHAREDGAALIAEINRMRADIKDAIREVRIGSLIEAEILLAELLDPAEAEV